MTWVDQHPIHWILSCFAFDIIGRFSLKINWVCWVSTLDAVMYLFWVIRLFLAIKLINNHQDEGHHTTSPVLTGQSPFAEKDYLKCFTTVTKFVHQTLWQWSLLTCRLLCCAQTIVWRSLNKISNDRFEQCYTVSAVDQGYAKVLNRQLYGNVNGWWLIWSPLRVRLSKAIFTKIIKLYNKKGDQGNVSQTLSVHVHLEND